MSIAYTLILLVHMERSRWIPLVKVRDERDETEEPIHPLSHLNPSLPLTSSVTLRQETRHSCFIFLICQVETQIPTLYCFQVK